jgi:hypothetical protein
MAGDNRPERKLHMSNSEELASKERRRRLIERLNEKEKLIGPHGPARRADERGGAGSRDREAEDTERSPAGWVLVLASTFSMHPSAWKANSQMLLQCSAPDTFLLRERFAGVSDLSTHGPQRGYSFVSFVAYAPHKLLLR